MKTIREQDTLELSSVIAGWDAEEKLAPEPKKKGSRAFKLYDVVRSIGDPATLNDIWKLIPASDLPKPRNKRELRDWLSSSCVSKGYVHKVAVDVYRIATLQEYEGIVARNKASAKKYTARIKAKEQRAARKEATVEAKEQARTTTRFGDVEQTTLEEQAKETMLKQAAWTAAKGKAREGLETKREEYQDLFYKDISSPSSVPQPPPSTPFINQYLGSLLGTSVAIVLFYVIVRVI